jgi:hypothetical protein
VGTNLLHPNGNIYDQVLLTGVSATVRSDPGQVARISFVDLNGDIVQVEFSGAGSLTIDLAAATGPAPAKKYNQAGVSYMTGHAALTILGSDATTNVGIFSVGTATAVNQSLFKAGEMYDGIADVQNIRIIVDPTKPNGATFGGIRAGNAQFWGTSGSVGILATQVQVQDVVVIGDLWTIDAANPVLTFGVSSQFGGVTIAGGDLSQPNGKPIEATGYEYGVYMAEGRTSGGLVLPQQQPRAQLSRGGIYYTIPISTGPVFPGFPFGPS